MLITYSKTDPRRGLTVEIDEDRARALIESGAATKATATPSDFLKVPREATAPAVEAKPAAKPAARKTAKKAK